MLSLRYSREPDALPGVVPAVVSAGVLPPVLLTGVTTGHSEPLVSFFETTPVLRLEGQSFNTVALHPKALLRQH